MADKNAGSTSELKGWRLWCFRLVAMTVVPALILIAVELGLRVCGVGYPTEFFLKTADGKCLVSNRKFCHQFYDARIATHPHPRFMRRAKPQGALRIFVLGESAAEGTPDPAYGFARILETMLRDRNPGKQIEVVNAAVRGINSHIIVPIARECALWEPDLFVVYMGNNEIIGLYSPEPGKFNLAAWPNLIRVRQWIKTTRMAQLLVAAAERSGSGQGNVSMDYFRSQRVAADDPSRRPVYANFERNLNEICDTIQKSKAKTVLATVSVNLQDCPPLGSLHRSGMSDSDLARWQGIYSNGIAAETAGKSKEAIQAYQDAAALDDHFAELHFRLARCLLTVNEPDRARQEFISARDWDALQFRSDGLINSIIRKTASARAGAGAVFCDVEGALATNALSGHGVPGEKLFLDQVHFTFDGDYAVALALLPSVEQSLGLGASSKPALSRSECALRLAFTRLDEFNVEESGIQAMANPPYLDQVDHVTRQAKLEQALATHRDQVQRMDINGLIGEYRKAIALNPDDWHLHLHCGDFYKDIKNHRSAAEEYSEVVRIFPYAAPLRIKCAQEQAEIGKRAEAIANINEAARLDPDHPAIKAAQAWAKSVK